MCARESERKRGRERERERKEEEGEGEKERQVGQVLAYLTCMDVNLYAFQLRCQLIYTNYGEGILKLSILLPFQLVRLTLIPGLHYLPDTKVRYLPHTSLESQVSLGSRLASLTHAS